jgi:hypothetical protein
MTPSPAGAADSNPFNASTIIAFSYLTAGGVLESTG